MQKLRCCKEPSKNRYFQECRTQLLGSVSVSVSHLQVFVDYLSASYALRNKGSLSVH